MRKKYLVLLLIPLLIALAGCGRKKIYVAAPPELEPPSNLTVTAISYKQINLSWKDNSTIEDGFRVCCDMGGNQYQTIATLGPNATEFTHSQLQPMTEYTYFVQSYRGEKYGNSREVSATTSCPVLIAYSNIGAISHYLFVITGKVQSYADEPCLAEITVCIYNPDTGLLGGTAKDRFYIGALAIKDFRVDCVSDHVWAGSSESDNYTVEVTDVEIEY